MTTPRYDVAIIGGGIIGLATALSLTARRSLSLMVVEAEDQLAAHQTGHNSGVIHSGLYYKPGSLKARNCVEGREALYRFCEEHRIAFERCGKVVVATRETELPALATLEERGRAALRGTAGNGLSLPSGFTCRRALEARPTENLEAYDLFVRANDLDWSGEEGNEAVRLLEKAVELDPEFALAYVRLCNVHTNQFYSGFDRSEQRKARALAAADEATPVR